MVGEALMSRRDVLLDYISIAPIERGDVVRHLVLPDKAQEIFRVKPLHNDRRRADRRGDYREQQRRRVRAITITVHSKAAQPRPLAT